MLMYSFVRVFASIVCVCVLAYGLHRKKYYVTFITYTHNTYRNYTKPKQKKVKKKLCGDMIAATITSNSNGKERKYCKLNGDTLAIIRGGNELYAAY